MATVAAMTANRQVAQNRQLIRCLNRGGPSCAVPPKPGNNPTVILGKDRPTRLPPPAEPDQPVTHL